MLTRRINNIILFVFTATGLALVFVIQDARIGTLLFVAVTALESGFFSLMYGLRSNWRSSDAARAVFWIIFAYFLVSSHVLTALFAGQYGLGGREVRQILYLGLAVAGLNITLTVIRLQQQDAQVVEQLRRDLRHGGHPRSGST